MPVFELSEELLFPPPELAEDDGLLAIGGDLSLERLIVAYQMGIFPWYMDYHPILWWSPDPRLVLFPCEFVLSRSMRQTINKKLFEITFDRAFVDVMLNCAEVKRRDCNGTWINEDMLAAYTALHEQGFAHSVESWSEGRLVGGLYGVALGGAFFGESMFALKSNASKAAVAALVNKLDDWGFLFIDCQVVTQHLLSLGAREIPRRDFMALLRAALKLPTRAVKWSY
ncbi:leucyl/phenylalanyl-tRNA--protein transferase [Candidatus Magnetominusculus xianensis]|uniref:Leucyl/phenylalanyl-tRNA--protein transferase n=1 Tax=Candidatus Magnetominusculus xianensis TaxID=1748249 RepID=A0ABR5SCJ9_9BACT|nr:leucyl/phenylalanyl-tRNA--protein transferase [Candidatus Magnetominusculus xianensis]KWT81173.1 leucyl/phenylalanyl-tRNA--protein transferase [Candidatus Magnetominusculus xianensis]MBF0404313.1 leucyl/phenylalanyl-tRNA--protein transferase [Nitrospirota bacterium]